MQVRQPPTRKELHAALRASGCDLDLDAALANPTIARCLTLAAEATRPHRATHAHSPFSDLVALNNRLRRLVGNIDHQLLRAGGSSHD